MGKSSPYLVKPDSKIKLSDYDPSDTGKLKSKSRAEAILDKHRKRLFEMQQLLYAEASHALLVVLQGLDASWKDGTIRHIFTGVNPQGCQVTSFKKPTEEELRHDFLWRVHRATPARGMIGIFNRSHYEDVLVVRVHGNLSAQGLKQRSQPSTILRKCLSKMARPFLSSTCTSAKTNNVSVCRPGLMIRKNIGR